MSAGRFNACFEFTIGQEGRYSCDPLDRGNWTSGIIGVGALVGSQWGISAPTLVSWLGDNAHIVTAEYVKSLSRLTARMIYKIRYWNTLCCDKLAAGVDLTVWDFGVNAGVSESALCLQRIVRVARDGIIGPQTLAAAGTWVAAPLIRALIAAHDQYYRELDDPRYMDGWLARQERLQTAALAAAGTSPEVKT